MTFKKKLFILMGVLRKKFESFKSKDNLIIFEQKWALGSILTLVLKVKEVSSIFKAIVFVRNLKGGQLNLSKKLFPDPIRWCLLTV